MDIPQWLLTTVTPLGALVGILVFIGLAIVKGHLMPLATHQYIVERHLKEVEDLNKALDRSQTQVSELLELSRTFNAVLVSLREKLEEDVINKVSTIHERVENNKQDIASLATKVGEDRQALLALETKMEDDRSSS